MSAVLFKIGGACTNETPFRHVKIGDLALELSENQKQRGYKKSGGAKEQAFGVQLQKLYQVNC